MEKRTMKNTSKIVVVALALMMLTTGCANNKMRDRMALLEQANLTLADQLNGMRGELDACLTERNDLHDQLTSAQRETDGLRMQLAVKPPPAEPAPGWTAVPGGAMIAIDDSVLFQVGKAVLQPQARRTLDGIVSALQGEYADKDILVFGHTDNQPIKKSGWKDNWELSSQRALAVVRHLQQHNVGSERLAACGCGEHRPRVPNSTEANRSTNRRVEIFALEPQVR